jgi:hypothetical protein
VSRPKRSLTISERNTLSWNLTKTEMERPFGQKWAKDSAELLFLQFLSMEFSLVAATTGLWEVSSACPSPTNCLECSKQLAPSSGKTHKFMKCRFTSFKKNVHGLLNSLYPANDKELDYALVLLTAEKIFNDLR